MPRVQTDIVAKTPVGQRPYRPRTISDVNTYHWGRIVGGTIPRGGQLYWQGDSWRYTAWDKDFGFMKGCIEGPTPFEVSSGVITAFLERGEYPEDAEILPYEHAFFRCHKVLR